MHLFKMKENLSRKTHWLVLSAIILLIFLARIPFGFAVDRDRMECRVKSFVFNVTPSECALIKSYRSDVVSFGVRLSDMQIVPEGLIRESQMNVRLVPVSNSVAKEKIGLRGAAPRVLVNGRSVYEVRDKTVYEFAGEDGQAVYIGGGVSTWLGDRIFKEKIEVLFQFEKNRQDFELIDSKLVDLLKRIELRRE